MLRVILTALVVISLTGCATTPRYTIEQQRQTVQDAFDNQKIAIEDEARSSRTTWVYAAQQVRLLDKKFAESLRSKGRSDLWVFDSNEEEYYAYCVALAEQLDKNQITFAQYDAARTKRLNESKFGDKRLQIRRKLFPTLSPVRLIA